MFKFDFTDVRNAMIFVVVETIVACSIGGCIYAKEVVITISDIDLIKTMEKQELPNKHLPIPETEKVPVEIPKPKLQTPKKKRRVYPVPQRIIKALCYKESGNNPNVIRGDNGKAIGILQIQWKYVVDVNTKFGTNYSHEDMQDPEIAKQVTRLYLGYWGYHLYSKGIEVNDEVLCRLHNGGPNGYYNNGSTVAINSKIYWDEMKSIGLL